MEFLHRRQFFILLAGDILCLVASLWISLSLRFKEIASAEVFNIHISAFLPIFILWIISFFIAGLYETHRVIIRNKLPEILIKTQVANAVIAIGFFYFFPADITPKIILTIFAFVSTIFLIVWRLFALFRVLSHKKQKAVMIASGQDAEALFNEVNKISYYNFEFTTRIPPSSLTNESFQNECLLRIEKENVEIIVVDPLSKELEHISPHFLNAIFGKMQFIDFYRLYGEVFYRLPVDLLGFRWFIQNIQISKRSVYDILKRAMDIIISIPATLVFLPFIVCGAIALKIEGGEIFSIQTRIGRFNKPIKLIKLRTMLFNDHGRWHAEGKQNKVTKVGAFLRKTRIDELPQVINVLKGDVSLIGPRSEFPDAVAEYGDVIAYYNVRHLIKPGLSGWAQIYHDEHPHHNDPEKVRKTKDKLAYDLYYIKNRSIVLDIMIALKTIKTLLSREGR